MREKFKTTSHNDINNKNLRKVFYVILEVTHKFYKAFQKQAAAADGERVCLFCLKVLFYLSHCKRLTKGLVQNGLQKFSQESMKLFLLQNYQQIQNFYYSKYARICAKNLPHKKFSFPLRISSISMAKSVNVSCWFAHIFWRNAQWKTSLFLCSGTYKN